MAIDGVEVARSPLPHGGEVLTADAVAFVAELHRTFNGRRLDCLQRRARRRAEIAHGAGRTHLAETAGLREDSSWLVPPPARDLRDRRVEITGPADAKMMINALNSGAQVFMADFEDSLTPTWDNVVQGQHNVTAAVTGTLRHVAPDGRDYTLAQERAVLMVRPRGWHLDERHLLVDGGPVSAALFDFGLFALHNAGRLLDDGSGPYCYLPKLESHLEARLWHDVFVWIESRLGLRAGSIRATVLVETVPAALEMDEILYELGDHAAGLNAGRWDYLFSMIKTFRDAGSDFVLPDRNSIGMTAPFMRAYTELLVRTCHRRGAFAIGGMSAFVPSRRDPQLNEHACAQVRSDKIREATDGFDGTWVAHPDLVPIAQEAFAGVLDGRLNQLDRGRDDVEVSPSDLLSVAGTPGTVTAAGLRNNVAVALRYLDSWLAGNGAVAISSLMEDAATAEIARAQVWQWVHNGVTLDTGEVVSAAVVRQIAAAELDAIRRDLGEAAFRSSQGAAARSLFERVALDDDFAEFITLPAYEMLG